MPGDPEIQGPRDHQGNRARGSLRHRLQHEEPGRVLAAQRLGRHGPSSFHRIGKFTAGGKATTEKIGEFSIDLATGGTISRDGKYIAIRNYTNVGYLWVRETGETLEQALAREPCKIPIATEAQGEAFDFLSDGTGYVTTSEGASAPLNVTLYQSQ